MQMQANAPSAGAKTELVAALRHLLGKGDAADRCYACHALGAVGDTAAIAALAECLRDEDIDVCVEAATALGTLGSPAGLTPLTASLLDDPDGEVKTAVIASLARIADPDTIPVLIKIAERRPADLALDDAEDWDPWWDMQREAVLALGHAGAAQAAPVLSRLLDDEDGQDIDAEVMASLARLGDAGEQALIARLGHAREQVRRRAATALGHGSSASGLEALSGALDDGSPQVRIAAAQALGKRAERQSLPAIIALYRDRDAAVRQAAIDVGAQLAAAGGGHAPDLHALRPLLADNDPLVRESALLGMHRDHLDPPAVARVHKALDDPDPRVAAAACALLARHGSGEQVADMVRIAGDAAADPALRRAALRALGSCGAWDATLAALMSGILSQAGSPVRLAALASLLELHRAGCEAESVPGPLSLVIAALSGDLISRDDTDGGPDPAAGGGSDAPVERKPDLPVTIAPPDGEVRAAQSSLQAIAIDNAEIALALDASEDEAQATPMEIDEETAEYLAITEANEATARWLFTRNALEADLDVRRLAARVLGSVVAPPAVAALLDALGGDDADLRREAAASLASIAERAPGHRSLAEGIEAVLDGAEAEDRDVRIACLRVLARLPDERAHARLVAGLDDPEPAVRIDAIHGLGASAAHAAAARPGSPPQLASDVGRLIEMLAQTEPGIRIATARALTEMLRGRGSDAGAQSLAVDALIRSAFLGTGDQAREMGRALRDLDADLATRRLLEELRLLATSAERRFAIEMLEEIHRVREPAPVDARQVNSTPTGEPLT